MSDHDGGGAGHGDHHHEESFWRKYVFSVDHKVIGIQYGVTSLVFLFIGFTLMILMRWQLAYPGEPVPLLGALAGAGLMLGLRCEVPNAELMARLRDGGLLTVPAAENVLRILPPLIIEAQQVEEALGILEQACADWPKAA